MPTSQSTKHPRGGVVVPPLMQPLTGSAYRRAGAPAPSGGPPSRLPRLRRGVRGVLGLGPPPLRLLAAPFGRLAALRVGLAPGPPVGPSAPLGPVSAAGGSGPLRSLWVAPGGAAAFGGPPAPLAAGWGAPPAGPRCGGGGSGAVAAPPAPSLGPRLGGPWPCPSPACGPPCGGGGPLPRSVPGLAPPAPRGPPLAPPLRAPRLPPWGAAAASLRGAAVGAAAPPPLFRRRPPPWGLSDQMGPRQGLTQVAIRPPLTVTHWSDSE